MYRSPLISLALVTFLHGLSVKAEDYRFEVTAPYNMSMALFEQA